MDRLNISLQTIAPDIYLCEKTLKLPFKLLPKLVERIISIDEIKREVAFKQEIFTTIKGKKVVERRETCWMADKGIGGLAYSGKIMQPVLFTPTIDRVRNFLEESTGIRYDCALLNLYPDGECAV